jgi:tripeptide aminopeptidase
MSAADGPDAARLFQIFFDLARIDSESGCEGEVCSYIRSFCSELGLAVHEDAAATVAGGQCGNLVVRVPAGSFSSLAPVLLCTHMDTVRPGNHVLPFDLGDRFVSMSDTVLGADCKAGIAAVLAAVEWLSVSGGPYRALELVFTVQEEPGLIGVKNLDMTLLDAHWGIVLDGSGPVGGIVIEAPAQEKIRVVVKGRAAHAGVEPEKGASAIVCAARGIAGIKVGRLDESTTSNIGRISGGLADNIVPELAVVEGEVRSMSDAVLEAESRRLVESFERAAEEEGCELEVSVTRSFEHFRMEDGTAPAHYLGRALAECGFEPFLKSSGGGSDANVLNRAGVQCAVMNIGLVNAHSKEEYILKDELHGIARTVGKLAYLAADEGGERAR